MAYKKGNLEYGSVYDNRKDDTPKIMGFYLPHSCDDWVIGTVEEAKQLITDLQKMIEEL